MFAFLSFTQVIGALSLRFECHLSLHRLELINAIIGINNPQAEKLYILYIIYLPVFHVPTLEPPAPSSLTGGRYKLADFGTAMLFEVTWKTGRLSRCWARFDSCEVMS